MEHILTGYVNCGEDYTMPDQNREIQQALKSLRRHMGYTQQQFAGYLKKAISTIARWETSRPPSGPELAHLVQVAIQLPDVDVDVGSVEILSRGEIVDTLSRGLVDEMREKAELLPRTLKESTWLDLLFLILRNRHLPEVKEAFDRAGNALLDAFDAIASRFRSGAEDVYGLSKDDIGILEAEAKDARQDLRGGGK